MKRWRNNLQGNGGLIMDKKIMAFVIGLLILSAVTGAYLITGNSKTMKGSEITSPCRGRAHETNE